MLFYLSENPHPGFYLNSLWYEDSYRGWRLTMCLKYKEIGRKTTPKSLYFIN